VGNREKFAAEVRKKVKKPDYNALSCMDVYGEFFIMRPLGWKTIPYAIGATWRASPFSFQSERTCLASWTHGKEKTRYYNGPLKGKRSYFLTVIFN